MFARHNATGSPVLAGGPRTAGRDPAEGRDGADRGPGPVGRVTASTVRQVCYGLAALIALVLTWTFNLRYAGSGGLADYLAAWFANDASSSAAVDLIALAVVASVFMVAESRRVGIRPSVALAFVVAGFVIAMSFSLPLFLLLRERRLASRHPRRQPEDTNAHE